MNNQLSVYRHELKYYINNGQAELISQYLKNIMLNDKNSNPSGNYFVRSLYFDTHNNKDYYEKLIGVNKRKKIRLRIYSLYSSYVKLEIKNKYNNYTHKETATISRQSALELISGKSVSLLSYNQPLCNKVFYLMHMENYFPTVIIDYFRKAYFYPFENIRVTIDSNISTKFNSYDFFNENINMIPIFNNNLSVLEIKYNHMIPNFLQKLLSSMEVQKSQISKYCLARTMLKK